MNKSLIGLAILSFLNTSFGQDIFSNIPTSSINAPKSKNFSSVSFKEKTQDIEAFANDDFPLEKTEKTINSLKPDTGTNTRSVRDAALFKNISPSVVLITTNKSLGSGSLIDANGLVLTNMHVVGKNKEVGVIFKPASDTQKISKTDIRRAKVIKVDEVSDLALLQVYDLPPGKKPLKLGDVSEINIGADVHAIGHPNGESWTYTKGVISQYRNEYKWGEGKSAPLHSADVIQTQTPINPGNSGGPLLTDNGTLIGVNSFKARDSEGMNFAVSIDNVKQFMARSNSRYLQPISQKKSTCEVKVIYEGKSDDNKSNVVMYDTKCNGKVDIEIITPYDKNEAMVLRMDRNGDAKPDVIIISTTRNMKWEMSLWDNNFDGKWDYVGYHKNGELKPARYETYEEFQSKSASR